MLPQREDELKGPFEARPLCRNRDPALENMSSSFPLHPLPPGLEGAVFRQSRETIVGVAEEAALKANFRLLDGIYLLAYLLIGFLCCPSY